MVAAVAGITDIGLGVDARRVAELRQSSRSCTRKTWGFAVPMPPALCWRRAA